MKKLLSILAAVGLTATASTAVVACTANDKVAVGPATVDYKGNVTYVTKDIVMAQSFSTVKGIQKSYGVFDKSGKLVKATIENPYVTSYRRDASYKLTIKFHIDDYKIGKKYTFRFGTIGNGDKLDTKFATFTPQYVSGSHAPENHVAKTQTFMEASAPATFNKKPTSDQLAQLFPVKDGDKVVSGVKYSFIENSKNNQQPVKTISLAAGITGNVLIKVPAPADSNPSKPASVSITPDKSAAAKLGATVPDKPLSAAPFTEYAVNINADLLATTNHHATIDDILRDMDDTTANAVAASLYANDKLKGRDALLAHKDDLQNNLLAAKGMSISSQTYNKDFINGNGSLIDNDSIFPDGSEYQIGLRANGQAYWFDLSFSKIIAGNVIVSNLQASDASTITASLVNDGQFTNQDLNKLKMVKVSTNSSSFDTSNIKSAYVDDNGILTVSLNKQLQKGDTVDLQVANANYIWTQSTNKDVYGEPIVSNVQVLSPSHVVATVSGNTTDKTDLVKNNRIKFYCGNMGMLPDSEIKEAKLQSDGTLDIKLAHHQIEKGCAVQVQVKDVLGEDFGAKSAKKIYGEPEVANLTVKSVDMLQADVIDMVPLNGSEWFKNEDLKKHAKVTVDGNQLDYNDIHEVAIVNGQVFVTLNKALINGQNIVVSLMDQKGNWINSNIAVLNDTSSISGLKFTTANTVDATMSGMDDLKAKDLVNGENLQVFVNGKMMKDEAISNVSVYPNRLSVTFYDELNQHDNVQIALKDKMNKWVISNNAILDKEGSLGALQFTARNTFTSSLNNMGYSDGQKLVLGTDFNVMINDKAVSKKDVFRAYIENGTLNVTMMKDFKENDNVMIMMKSKEGSDIWVYSDYARFNDPATVTNLHVASSNQVMADINNMPGVSGDLRAQYKVEIIVNGNATNSQDDITSSYAAGNKVTVGYKEDFKQGDKIQIAVQDNKGIWDYSNKITYNDISSVSNLHVYADNALVADLNGMDSVTGDIKATQGIEVFVNGKVYTADDLYRATAHVSRLDGRNVLQITFNSNIFKQGDNIQIAILDPMQKWDFSNMFNFNDPATVTNIKAVDGNTVTADLSGMDDLSGDLESQKRIQVNDLRGTTWVSQSKNIASAMVTNGKLEIKLMDPLQKGDKISIVVRDAKDRWVNGENSATFVPAPLAPISNVKVGTETYDTNKHIYIDAKVNNYTGVTGWEFGADSNFKVLMINPENNEDLSNITNQSIAKYSIDKDGNFHVDFYSNLKNSLPYGIEKKIKDNKFKVILTVKNGTKGNSTWVNSDPITINL